MEPSLWIDELTFSDGKTLHFNAGDVIVIVGPNNSGKSATLRAIRDKVLNLHHTSPIVKKLDYKTTGSPDDVIRWLARIAKCNFTSTPGNPQFAAFGTAVHENQVRQFWTTPRSGLLPFGRFFCHLLSADERLAAANPAQTIAVTSEPLTHPIHHLYRYDNLEPRLSNLFRKAFGIDLVVHRAAGRTVPLHVGERPVPKAGEDRVSLDYVLRLEQLPTVETQGDGIRSFAGVLLHTSIGPESVLLIDEPEAFLHPPQAKLLGRMLVEQKPQHRQVWVATHSGDVLRGVLDGNAGNVRVIRIRRAGDVNHIKELKETEVKLLWTDPLLRSSNILDGVFHERVVVCESDGDARFYNAIGDALYDGPLADQRKPDVMFTHCGGKNRLPMVVRALRALDVPVAAVADFDVLNDEHPLSELVIAAGGDWELLKPMWNSVKKAIDAIKPQLSTDDVKKEIEQIFAGVTTTIFPKDAKKRIEDVLKRASPWGLAKRLGKAFVPSGTPTQEYFKLDTELRQLRIFVVDVGELERFYPGIGGHGPTWVNEVLTKDLKSDSALEAARKFVTALLS